MKNLPDYNDSHLKKFHDEMVLHRAKASSMTWDEYKKIYNEICRRHNQKERFCRNAFAGITHWLNSQNKQLNLFNQNKLIANNYVQQIADLRRY